LSEMPADANVSRRVRSNRRNGSRLYPHPRPTSGNHTGGHMRRNRNVPRGQVHRLTLTSEVLAGNLLGDPTERELHVYTPAGYSEGTRLPLLVDIVGFTGSGMSHTNWRPF